MFDRETHFLSKAQNLKSPTSAESDDSAWQVAFDDAPDKSEADRSIRLAALWFASQSWALRQSLNPGLDALGGRVSVILAVAALNREFLTASQIAKEGVTQAQAKGALAFDHMVARRSTAVLQGKTSLLMMWLRMRWTQPSLGSSMRFEHRSKVLPRRTI